MGVLVDFLQFVQKCLKWGMFGLVGVVGLIGSAVVGLISAVGTAFSHFTWLETATGWVNAAASTVSNVVNVADSPLTQVLFGWCALDRAVQILGVVIGATFGATISALITLFLAVFALVPTVLTVRAILKLIQTGTAGVVDP